MADVDPFETDRVIEWVLRHDFRRVALQLPEYLLHAAPAAVKKLRQALPQQRIFVLGALAGASDGSGCVDEVGAAHYGADCVVHIGPSDQVRAGSLPVLFIYERAGIDLPTLEAESFPAVLKALQSKAEASNESSTSRRGVSLLLLCDVALQHELVGLVDVASKVLTPSGGALLVAEPCLEASLDEHIPAPLWSDPRYGPLFIATAWWAGLGALVSAAAAQVCDSICHRPFQVCGQQIRLCSAPGAAPEGLGTSSSSSAADLSLVVRRKLPAGCGIAYLGPAGSAFERRLLLRFGNAHEVWRIDPSGAEQPKQLSSQGLLLQRYRLVESVRGAGSVGLLLSMAAPHNARAIADRLEVLLSQAGRSVYRFVISQVSAEMLGNFPEVECFVSLASAEHFPFDTKDIPFPIASPYEVEVALGVRPWTGEYLIDLEELLSNPPLSGPSIDAFQVQTLGASGKIMHFSSAPQGGFSSDHKPVQEVDVGAAAPAIVQPGQHGVAASYSLLAGT